MRRMTPPAPVSSPAVCSFPLELGSAAKLLIAALLIFSLSSIHQLIAKKATIIMCVKTRIVLDRQLALRRAMNRRGMLLKIVADDSGLPYSTVASYLPDNKDATPHMMSVAALFTLIETGALPCDLISRLLPEGYQIIKADEGIDHDELAAQMHDYLQTKTAAHCPNSPDGRELSDCETAALNGKATALKAVGS